ncbi:hypothetical protein PV04_07518 [Phialophora macrospora]|uniref:Uncharacterized protein n=1 Tax=Phialophora macrospora TaxID=1851006 RepID=A0A0D2FB51_9EURO|nr:hypothetical protein PV04_07518 [Phialophora macrospora]
MSTRRTRQTTYINTTTHYPGGRRRIEEELVVRTRDPVPYPRSPSPSLTAMMRRRPSPIRGSLFRDSRFPHPLYEANPRLRRSYERSRSRRERPRSRSRSTVRFGQEESVLLDARRRRPHSPIRGAWEEDESSSDSEGRGASRALLSSSSPSPRNRLRGRSPSPSPSRSRSRNRGQSQTQRRRTSSPSRSFARGREKTDDGFIKGALAASVTALAIRGARSLLDGSGRPRSRSRSGSRNRDPSRRRRL